MKTCWKLLMVLLVLALLVTGAAVAESTIARDNGDGTHTVYDADHNPIETSAHMATCKNQNVCAVCGCESDGMNWSHAWISVDNHDNTHTNMCELCGWSGGTDHHSLYCDADGACECGVVGDWPLIHRGEMAHQDRGDGKHDAICSACGTVYFTTNHINRCQQSPVGVCTDCGAAMDDSVTHQFGGYVSQGEYLHGIRCSGCGEITSVSAHVRACNDPESAPCQWCNAVGVTTKAKHHYNVFSEMDNGDGTHSRYCAFCNHQESVNRHEVSCTNTGATRCEACGGLLDGTETVLHYSTYAEDLGNGTHAVHCRDCNQVTEIVKHQAYCNRDANECAGCKANYPCEIKHYYNAEGECTACHATKEFGPCRHNKHLAYVSRNAYEHAVICADCYTELRRESHERVKCTENRCICGYDDGEVPVAWQSHGDFIAISNNDGTHHYECVWCGQNRGYEYKCPFASCMVPGACAQCGYEIAGLNIMHVYPAPISKSAEVYRDNKDGTHTMYGELCGEVSVTQPPKAQCTQENKRICMDCGIEQAEPCELYHDWGALEYQDCGDGMHAMVCTDCGTEKGRQRHYINCGEDSEKECRYCGVVDLRAAKFHWYEIPFATWIDLGDGTCAAVCDICGDYESTRDSHAVRCDQLDEKICNRCGNEVDMSTTRIDHSSYEVMTDLGDGTHQVKCSSCGNVSIQAHEQNCVYRDGKCKECGAVGDWRLDHVFDVNDPHCKYCGDPRTEECTHPADACILTEGGYHCSVCGETLVLFILPASLQRIDSQAFAGVEAYVVEFPADVSYIAEDTFANSSVKAYIAEPGSYADEWCSSHGMNKWN